MNGVAAGEHSNVLCCIENKLHLEVLHVKIEANNDHLIRATYNYLPQSKRGSCDAWLSLCIRATLLTCLSSNTLKQELSNA